MLKIILIFSAYLVVKYAEQYFDFFSPYWEEKYGVNILNNKSWKMVKLHRILIPYFFDSYLENILNDILNIFEKDIVKIFWFFMGE